MKTKFKPEQEKQQSKMALRVRTQIRAGFDKSDWDFMDCAQTCYWHELEIVPACMNECKAKYGR